MGELSRFNSLFNDTFFNDFFRPMEAAGGERVPAIDVHDNAESYSVKVDLPGIQKEDIHVSVENGVLIIQADNEQQDKVEKDGKVVRQERFVGHYVRRLSIGDDVNAEQIQASFKDGVLALELPKKPFEQQQQHRIAVE